MDRSLGPQIKPKRKADYLLVGSSNASKMLSKLKEKGKSTSLKNGLPENQNFKKR
jgi:hypothetical protein